MRRVPIAASGPERSFHRNAIGAEAVAISEDHEHDFRKIVAELTDKR